MSLRDDERRSIEDFLRAAAKDGYVVGKTLDIGCGHQPYKGLLTAYGSEVEYHGYDRPNLAGSLGVTEGADVLLNRGWQTIICTQVIQYVDNPFLFLREIRSMLMEGVHASLVITGPTNWPVVESADKWRYTPAGIGWLLGEVGFREVDVRRRAVFDGGGEPWLVGWGATARP